MKFVNATSYEILDLDQIKALFSNVSIPVNMNIEHLGWQKADDVALPALAFGQIAVESDPVLVGDRWTQTWSVVNLPSIKVAATLSLLIEDKRVEVATSGLAYDFGGVQGTVQTRNSTDLLNVNALATNAILLKGAGIVSDDYLFFRDEENITHKMTPDQMIDMATSVSKFVGETYRKKWVLSDKIAVLDFDGLSSFDIEAEWLAV